MPRRTFMSAKIHGATLTSLNLDYEGSISVDSALLDAVGILPYERMDVYNLDNGERLTTYAIPGNPGEICLNGAAAHKGKPGQRVILVTYLELEPEEIPAHRPRVIRVDAANRPEAAHE
ncbi:MAG: aspartate 1-decarboxylase [Desulfovibrio sp.]|nr:aspartate 1-decarboxylase [Desulfovibrio sp.]